MIAKLRMTALRNPEFLGYHKNVLTIITQNNPAALMIEAQTTAYSEKISEMENLYKKDTFNPITAEIEELDHQRDEIFIGITNLLTANSSHFIPEKKEAAILLERDLEKYGSGITRENYAAETIDLENIINDWRNKPELTAAMTILQITSWIDELDRINQLFDSKYIARTSSYAAESNETTKDKRKEITTTYETLSKYLNSYSVLNDSPEYRKTISEMNELTGQFALLLKQRKGTSAAKKVAKEQQ